MKLRTVVVQEGTKVTLDTEPNLSTDWLNDGVIRWLNVENATRDELEQLFGQLGVDGKVLADHITGDQWSHTIEREQFFIVALAEPTAWLEHEKWFNLVRLPQTIISVHSAENPAMDAFIQRRWLDRPGPKANMEDVILRVIQCYVEEEVVEFSRIRLEVERHAEGLKSGDESFTVEHVEKFMTASHHMATVFYEFQRLCEGLEFIGTRADSTGTHKDVFGRASQNLRILREGIEQVQRRLEGLQRQHLMDQQGATEARVRVLTILSAVVLPLTLIAGVYGMNFTNMPELDERYAYFAVLGGMGVVAIAMVTFFYFKGWFR